MQPKFHPWGMAFYMATHMVAFILLAAIKPELAASSSINLTTEPFNATWDHINPTSNKQKGASYQTFPLT